jgi:thioredoxin-related protein
MSACAALVVALALSVMPAAAEFKIEPLDYDFPSEVEAAAAEGKNIVIMFHLNWCPYCDKMRKRVFPHPQVNAFYSEKFYLIEVNIKGDLDVTTPEGEAMVEKDYAEKMRVRATPVILFLSKEGAEALKLTGYQDPEMFMTAGRYVSSDAFKDGTSFLDYVRAGR